MGNALKFSIGGDATGFARAMDVVASIAKNSGNQTIASLSQAGIALEKAMVKATGAGESTQFYAEQLSVVTARLREMTAAQNAATANANDFAAMQAKIAANLAPGAAASPQTWLRRRDVTGVLSPEEQNAARLGPDHLGDIASQKAFDKKMAVAKARMQTRKELLSAEALEEMRMQAGLGRGGGRFGSSIATTMFVSVARDTAASLASGANPLTVFLQQAPQVAQAFTMMGRKIPFIGLLFKKSFGEAADALIKVADADKAAATASALTAVADREKAAASALAASGNGAEALAARAGAKADEEKAVASVAAARASATKATASEAAAAASVLEAKASKLTTLAMGPLAIALGVIAGLAVGVYIGLNRLKSQIEILAGLQLPDFSPEVRGKVDRVADAWRGVNMAVREAIDNYRSVTEAAKRFAEVAKQEFDHGQKMLDLEKRRRLAGAKTPAEKMAVEKEFDRKKLEADLRDRAAATEAKRKEAADLIAAGEAKIKKMTDPDGLGKVQSAEAAADQEKIVRSAADAARAKIKEIRAKTGEGFFNGVPIEGTAKQEEFRAADLKTLSDSQDRIRIEKDFLTKKKADDLLRAEKAKLQSEADAESKRGAELVMQAARESSPGGLNDVKAKSDLAELTAKWAADLAELEKPTQKSGGRGTPDVTDRQRIGLMSVGNSPLIDIGRQQLRELQRLNNKVGRGGSLDSAFGGTR